MNQDLFLQELMAHLLSTENVCPGQFPAILGKEYFILGFFSSLSIESFPSFLPCSADILGHNTVEFDKMLVNQVSVSLGYFY